MHRPVDGPWIDAAEFFNVGPGDDLPANETSQRGGRQPRAKQNNGVNSHGVRLPPEGENSMSGLASTQPGRRRRRPAEPSPLRMTALPTTARLLVLFRANPGSQCAGAVARIDSHASS